MDWKRQISLGNELSYLSILSSIFLLTGILAQAFLLVFVGLLFLLFVFANRYYLKNIGTQLSVSVNKEQVKLFKGEDSNFALTLNQKGKLPILNGQIRLTVDYIVGFQEERQILETEQVELTLPVSILGRKSFSIELPFEGRKRGVARIRTLEVIIPHMFGFGEVYLQLIKPIPFETVVYSSPVSVGGIEKIVPKHQGDYPLRKSYFEDMTALVGARSYVPTDPFNRVHWKASARTNELQTKLFNRTAQFSWTIMINVRERKLEQYLSGLTFLLESATIKSIPFEIFVNVRKAGKSPYIHVPMGSGREHLAKALELIARLSKHSVTIPFHYMIHAVERQQILSPYIIMLGEIEENEQMLLHGFSKKGVDCFKVVENEEAIYLVKASSTERRVNSHAI
ncbi:DUF58 domain-containing protein [Fredinandcohnia sp. 179-A 10B2 NHS]|uniref:DUF58 domain-containing protein n=1 Tax=Fredinandcohnia sp. 179-A 10B2 NHS TaxID=3235176 RepID=UPI0039A0971A